jgi:hypothetical protein
MPPDSLSSGIGNGNGKINLKRFLYAALPWWFEYLNTSE